MKKLVFTISFFCFFGAIFSAPVKLIRTDKAIEIRLSNNEDRVVHTALDIFSTDVEKVSGIAPTVTNSLNPGVSVVAGTLGKDKELDKIILARNIDTDKIKGEWEAFQIQVVNDEDAAYILVIGSDSRGTAYGIMELSRLIGVSPWEWWADVTPDKKTEVTISEEYFLYQKPSVQYRGIFLNDEDWGLMPWSSKHFEPSDRKGQIGPKTYGKIFELLLRLRANTLWPAMHECTVPFYFVEGNKEMADKYGIVIGTSHCEPLMRNSAGEWDAQKFGDYNYLTNKKIVLNYWAERLKDVGKSENFYTVGMRGVHDGKMEGVKTLEEQTNVLSEVLKDQRNLLRKYVSKDVTKIPQAFIPYKEVLEIYDNKLDLPEDITLVWCDDNYGYLTRLSDEEEQKRLGGSGIYYHISYWGRPHDYLWLSTTQPALMYWQLKTAWDNNARKLWIVNVGDIKPSEYNIEFFLDMAWSIDSFESRNTGDHLKKYYSRDFGAEAANDIFGVMDEYYRLASVRKPEFMGWSRVEEYSAAVKNGRTPVIDTEFNPYMFGDEITIRLQSYDEIAAKAEQIENLISPEKREAFFQLISYPVTASAEMNKKLLYGQKSRLYQSYNLPVANEYAEKSNNAFRKIEKLTQKYNETIAGGKWNGMMDMKPRNLAVFQPLEFTEVKIDNISDKTTIWVESFEEPITENTPVDIPSFVFNIKNSFFINFLQEGIKPIDLKTVNKPEWLVITEKNTSLETEKRIELSPMWDRITENTAESTFDLDVNGEVYTFNIRAVKNTKSNYEESQGMVALNAFEFSRKTGNVNIIDGLGHSNRAVELLPGEENAVEYDLYTTGTGNAAVRSFLIPNHPLDKDLRYAISVDGGEPQVVSLKTAFRSEPWKINVLRNQSVKTTLHALNASGKHTIKIYALDRGIILDQLMLDFDANRKFYMVPVWKK